MKKYIFKTRSYLKNVVNICIINDLSYPPATHLQIIRMHFLLPDHGLSTAPADITAIRASLLRTVCRYQQHHWEVREFVCVDCVRRMLFIQDLQPENLGI